MALNNTWIGLIIIGLITASYKFFVGDDPLIFDVILKELFNSADLAFQICLGLAGIMILWMGFMNVGKDAGLIQKFSKFISPLFGVIFPKLKEDSPAYGSMSMNFSANMLGLDNAATPLGLEAMQDLQKENPEKEKASDPMIMFMALNTAGITLIPTSVIALRQTAAIEQLQKAKENFNEEQIEALTGFNGADIFLPTLIVTFISFIFAMVMTSFVQKINIFKWPFLVFMLIFGSIVYGLFYYTQSLPPDEMESTIAALGSGIILLIIFSFLLAGIMAKINVYNSFIEGAKGGFDVVIGIAPYLVAMLIAISVFRHAGCLDYILNGVKYAVASLGWDTRFVDALPVAFMKPLSGGGARGVLVDVMNTHGVNSFASNLGSIMQGGTETTFYVLAVYFGSVGIKDTRYAVWVGLLADFVAMVIAIFVAYYFYGELQ